MENAARTYTGRGHPATSHAAAESIAPDAATLRERIFLFIEASGAEGMTADEIEQQTVIKGSTVRPRVLELVEAGRIVRTERTRPTRSNRQAFVYVAGTPEPPPVRTKGGVLVLDLEFD